MSNLVIVRDVLGQDFVTEDYINYWSDDGELVPREAALLSPYQMYKITDFNTVTHVYNRLTHRWQRALFIPYPEDSDE